ncbi:hypothetical protein [Rhodococcus opacus]|uniref:hypothetical protein n=1 Tax=Rhodococcus opacus TaxID=37919 RepID=UPI002473E41E|nr:hypothetical protein [Rhodococcus opacus]MDH6293176.1 hypothetical protein [Rhodococcus opacus]
MSDVVLVDGVLVPAGVETQEGWVFPPDGAYVALRDAVGWLVVDPVDRAGQVRGGKAAVALLVQDVTPGVSGLLLAEVSPGDLVLRTESDTRALLDSERVLILQVLGEHRREREARAELAAARREHEQRIESLVDDAHTWADENSLCGQFDRFMDEHGLRSRSREFVVECAVTITAKVSVRVSASDSSAAEDRVESGEVARALGRQLGGFRRHGLELDDYTVTGVEEA